MAMFGKPREQEAPAMQHLPIDQVMKFRQEGLTNNQIVQSLQRSGFRTDQIFDAMNQADMRTGAPLQDALDPSGLEQPPAGPDPGYSEERPPTMPAQPQQRYDETSPSPSSLSDERMEEIAEAIIEEKWEELVANVDKIVTWKKSVETRMTNVEKELAGLSKQFNSLHSALFDRMDAYDKNVSKIGSNFKAMEQVFTKTLPSLSDNVNELSRITKTLKSARKSTSKT